MKSWIKILNPKILAQNNLICLPHAGGYSAAFRPLSSYMNTDWRVITVDPPGHGGNRLPLMNDLEQLVSLYLRELKEFMDGPFVLFGHSLGGRIVHRMAQELQDNGHLPQAVIVSASPPPDIVLENLTDKNDTKLLEYIMSLGGIPEEFMEHKELIDMYLPIFRADFQALERHVQPSTTRIRVPFFVLSGTEDIRCSPLKLQSWSKWSDNVEFMEIPGGHMFLLGQAEKVAMRLKTILRNTGLSLVESND
ncbi:thioesterase II family protein [Alicyclobacillus fodiniaquatilis]|uniref:Thioesterase II family protein n=1 Tax=Alicyclobacillus fodiniaquatilis TaxID=1661150 RepID=A0ABW4JJF5_9BACL